MTSLLDSTSRLNSSLSVEVEGGAGWNRSSLSVSLIGEINFVWEVLLDISIPESDEGCEKVVAAMMTEETEVG